MRINQIKLSLENIALDTKVRLVEVRDTYDYQDGKLTDKKIGVTYTLLAEKSGFEKFTCKCSELKPLATQEQLDASEPVYVSFEGFVGKFWFSNRTKTWEISCKADKAILVKSK
jgi:hypothetical protein